MEHYQATIEYDGGAFYGFQRQPAVRTVQGVLEAALTRLQGGVPVTVRGAGRTDRGVHATGQVIAFRLDWSGPPAGLSRALNGLLPADVAVLQSAAARPTFDPRRDAVSRSYLYRLHDGPVRRPLLRHTTLRVARPLDVAAMDAAAGRLVGAHDFAPFGRPIRPGGITLRQMHEATVARQGETVVIRLTANAFLNRMVRTIAGCLLVVGRGEAPPVWLAELLARGKRARVRVLAPHGVTLVGVAYEEPEIRSER